MSVISTVQTRSNNLTVLICTLPNFVLIILLIRCRLMMSQMTNNHIYLLNVMAYLNEV